MTAIAWKSGVSGDWSTKDDWTTGTVPATTDDATISIAGTYQVSITTPQAVRTLTVNNPQLTIAEAANLSTYVNLNIIAGTWNILSDAGIPYAGGTLNNAGLLEKTGGTGVSTIGASILNTGTVESTSGTLRLFNGGSFGAGSFIGTGGTVEFNAGTFSLGTGKSTIGGGVALDGSAHINLGSGATLTMAGNDSMSGGGIYGSGTEVVPLHRTVWRLG